MQRFTHVQGLWVWMGNATGFGCNCVRVLGIFVDCMLLEVDLLKQNTVTSSDTAAGAVLERGCNDDASDFCARNENMFLWHEWSTAQAAVATHSCLRHADPELFLIGSKTQRTNNTRFMRVGGSVEFARIRKCLHRRA